MATNIKDTDKLKRQDRTGGTEEQFTTEREEKLRKQKQKEDAKIGKRIDPVTLKEIDVTVPPKRDYNGRIILQRDVVNPNLNSDEDDQFIKIKMDTPSYDTSEFETVLNNVVTELLPKPPEFKKELTIPERIDKFFIEYEFLRDHIWDLKKEASTKSHVYLEKESDSYLPKRKKPSAYTGEQVGLAGRVKLVSGNKMICREAVFTSNMKGAKVTAYGLEPQKDSVLEVEHILKTVQSRLFKLNDADDKELNDIDVMRFIKHLKRSLLSKYETEQVRRSEMKDLSKLIKESIEKFYPDEKELVKRIELKEEADRKAGTAAKIKKTRSEINKIKDDMKKKRLNRRRKFMNPRFKTKKRPSRDPNKRSNMKNRTSRKRNA